MYKFFDARLIDYAPKAHKFIEKNLLFVKKIPIIKKIVRYLFYSHNFIIKIKYYLKLRKYFK